VDEAVVAAVRARAGYRCEYCLIPAARAPGHVQIEHIIPRKLGGSDALANLALACPFCNSHKSVAIAAIDWVTSRTKLVRLFHPRRHRWGYHFALDGPYIVGRTPIGRVTVLVLNLNDPAMTEFREALMAEGQYPPPGR
jgi:hypothetical protein